MRDSYGIQVTLDGGVWIWKWRVVNYSKGDFKLKPRIVDLQKDLASRGFVSENFETLYDRPRWT